MMRSPRSTACADVELLEALNAISMMCAGQPASTSNGRTVPVRHRGRMPARRARAAADDGRELAPQHGACFRLLGITRCNWQALRAAEHMVVPANVADGLFSRVYLSRRSGCCRTSRTTTSGGPWALPRPLPWTLTKPSRRTRYAGRLVHPGRDGAHYFSVLHSENASRVHDAVSGCAQKCSMAWAPATGLTPFEAGCGYLARPYALCESHSQQVGAPRTQERLRRKGAKAQPAAAVYQPRLIAEEEDDYGMWSGAADGPPRGPPSGNSLALLRRLTTLLEEARTESAVAAVLECPELLAIDIDLQDDAVRTCNAH